MRLSYALPSRLARGLFAVLMMLIWCGVQNTHAQPATRPTAAAESPADRAQRAEELARSIRALQDADQQLPRDTFDVQAVAKAQGPDATKLFEWVRDQTIWVPYRGSLRGETGVLMDRMGSSLDRALLLAALLKAGGHEVRLARGELSLEQATQVLSRMPVVPQALLAAAATTRPANPTTGPATVPDALSAAAQAYGLDERRCRDVLERLAFRHQKTREVMAARLASQVPRLMELLLPNDSPQVRAAYDAAVKAAQDSLRDHWWVQRQDGDNWIDLDPLTGDAKPGDRLVNASQTMDAKDLPAELFHQVEIRVVVEQWEAGSAKEATLLRKALRPAELLGKRVSVGCMPMDWPQDFQLMGEDLSGRIARAALQQREWVPLLSIDGDVTIQSSVTDTGQVIEKPALTAAHRVGGGSKKGMEQALDVFGAPQPGAPAADAHLTAQWLEYEVRMPGQQRQVVRRELFDLIGPAARARDGGLRQFKLTDAGRMERALGMMTETEVLALPCRVPEPFVFHLYAQGLISNGPLLAGLIKDQPQDPKILQPQLLSIRPMLSELYGLAMLRQDSPVAAYTYVDQPVILTLRQFFRPRVGSEAVTAHKAFDIVSNAVAVHRWSPIVPSYLRLVQGVVDTNAEALALTDVRRGANAGDALALADERGDAWAVVRPAEEARLAELRVPEDARLRIRQHLAAGHIVLGPAGEGENPKDATWWRVDPVTGQTLGFCDPGWGGSLAEHTALVFFVVFALAFTLCTLTDALGSGSISSANVLYCLGMAIAIAAAVAAAFYVGAIIGGAAAAGGGGAAAGGAGAAGGAAAAGGSAAAGGGAAAAGGGAVAGGGAAAGGAAGGGAAAGAAAGGSGAGVAGTGVAAGPWMSGAFSAGGAGAISPAAGTFVGGGIGSGGGAVVGGGFAGGVASGGTVAAGGAAGGGAFAGTAAGGGVVVGGGAVGGGAFAGTAAGGGGVVVGGGAAGGGAVAATQAGAAAAGTGGAVGAVGAGGTIIGFP